MMKTILHYAILIVLLSTASCSGWLEVKPANQVKRDVLFETQEGFEDALTGVYIRLKGEGLYGAAMTFRDMEYPAQHWSASGMETYQYALTIFNYETAAFQALNRTLFNSFYVLIADVNAILEHIDARRDVFEPGEYERIKAEALAIRAFAHFDLLRIWGPMPSGEIPQGPILPYVKRVTIDNLDWHDWTNYTTQLAEDLDMAEELLAEHDPAIETMDPGKTHDQRNIYMNYYAVLGLQARFHLWMGEKQEAARYAQMVIDAQRNGGPMFRLGNKDDIENETYTFPSEHIMGLHMNNMVQLNKDYFSNGTLEKDKTFIENDLYDPGSFDIRLKMWAEMTATAKKYVLMKYRISEKAEKIETQIPLIRLSEMYFIAMECGTLEQANKLYGTFCVSRNIPSVTLETEYQLETILADEYNKEFYAEGQMFFYYKRTGASDIKWAQFKADEEAYVWPLPKNMEAEK